jgi:hypothetical protein
MYLGTDPELAILDKSGRAIPAFMLGIPYKDAKVKNGTGTASWFRDNWAVEFNTTQPYTCTADVTLEVSRAKAKLNKQLAPKGMKLQAAAAFPVDTKYLVGAPEDMQQFGCDPDYCAYELCAKRPEIDANTHGYRYGGGHLHFSTDNLESSRFVAPYCRETEKLLLDDESYPEIVKRLDAYLGLAATYLWDDPMQFERRKYYGQAGRFRPQKYPVAKTGYRVWGPERSRAMGVEYRTPPPQIFDKPEIAEMFLSVGRWVIHNFHDIPWDKQWEPFVQDAINTGNGVEAIVKRFAVPKHYDFPKLQALKSSLA